jgi:cytochrome P450
VKALEPMVRSTCADLVDRIAAGGPADLVADLGVPLPALVISQLAGLEAGDATVVREYCDDFVSAVADPSALDPDGLARCAHFEDELQVRIATRRAAITVPDDLLTALAKCPGDDGAPISIDRVLTHLTKDVFIGGLETTTHLIGNLFFEILTTDGLYDRLRADRSLVPAAVEESLRHLSPVQIAMRRVATETELAGTTLPSGGIVVLGLGSANRDEAVFTEPDRYDVDRDEAELRSHVAFDRGIHACVGAGLVRLEARVALETVLDRFRRLELAPGATYERVRHFMMRGPSSVVVAPDV